MLQKPQRRTDSSDGDAVRVWRRDRIEVNLGPAVRTPQGYLRTHAAVAVPGILPYEDLNGNVVRELITADELHKTDSLQTLASVPMTIEHPEEDVTPENVGELGVGSVGEEVEILKETGHVRITLVIRRKDGLQAVKNGKLEVSPGYTTIIDPTPGVHPVFGPYDAVQTNRRYNHLAIVDEARGGPTIRLRADGARSAVSRLDALPPKAAPTNPAPPAGDFMNPHLLTLAALLSLPYSQRADGTVHRTDQGEEEGEPVGEAKLLSAIAEAIGGLQDAIAGAGASEGEGDAGGEEAAALKTELEATLAKVAELEGALAALSKEKTDAEEEEQAKTDKAELGELDKLATALKFDTAAWRDDTKNDARKLDLVRHKGIVDKDATPEPAAVNGMIQVLFSSHKTDDTRSDAGAWKRLNDQVDGKPPTENDDDDRRDSKAAADPFKARIAKARADANA